MKKKGVSQYVGWVLLIGMAIALAAMMYNWTRGFTERQVDDLEARTDDLVCESVNFDVSSACQNSQTLNMNITNTNNLRIQRLNFQFIDLYGNSESRTQTIKLFTGDNQKIRILKQGTLAQARVTPVVKKDNTLITCQQKSVAIENIEQC